MAHSGCLCLSLPAWGLARWSSHLHILVFTKLPIVCWTSTGVSHFFLEVQLVVGNEVWGGGELPQF